MAIDINRMKELDAMVRRMGALSSIFEVRADSIGNRRYCAFRDLMDLYVDLCDRQMKDGVDFLDESAQPTQEEVERFNAIFERIFGCPPDQFKA